MNWYGQAPTLLGEYDVKPSEMMFYQYLPIKMPGTHEIIREKRLQCFDELTGVICCDYIGKYGLDDFVGSYLYLTAKHLYQTPGCSFNRPGWHSDGFMTKDINYVWCDKNPTIFNSTNFNLTLDDELSLKEMESQADPANSYCYAPNSLLRLCQFNIHKVADVINPGMRTFLKLSFSCDKYDLIGNSHNYEIEYDWQMRNREVKRNIPQQATPNNTGGGNATNSLP